MTQEAIVSKLLANNYAEVNVTRVTACGGNCENCEACVTASSVATIAKNNINAKQGDKVLIDCKTSKIFKAIALVYVLPIILLIAGYALSYSIGLSEGLCILSSFLGVILGGVIIVLSQKRGKRMQFSYEITEIL